MTRQPSRLVLFDIDGTLLTSAGVATETFGQCLSEVAGRPISTRDYSMAGKTDPQIVRELLLRGGCAPEEIARLSTEVLRLYIERFGSALIDSPRPRLFPGVRELLAELTTSPVVLLGLLTGNIEAGARLKLDHFGLRDHFRLGAYGSDSPDRRALVPIAVERAHKLTGRSFAGREVVVIGDTPLDIDCGRAWGATTIAVATGPFSFAELESHTPHALFPDFAAMDAVYRAIVGPVEPEAERREA